MPHLEDIFKWSGNALPVRSGAAERIRKKANLGEKFEARGDRAEERSRVGALKRSQPGTSEGRLFTLD